MRQHKKILVTQCKPPADDPRTARDPAVLQSTGESMKSQGQHLPVLAYIEGESFILLDGITRWMAARLVGITELDAIVFDVPPTPAEQSLIIATIDVHRTSLNPMERARLLCRIQEQKQCGVGELAVLVSMSQPLVSKLLAVPKLLPVIQQKLETGEIDLEKAYIISQEPDPAKQLILANSAGGLDRTQLRQQVRGAGKTPIKTSSAKFPLTPGMTVSVQGRDVSLSDAIDALTDTAKELKKALSQNLDIVTAARVMKDKAKARA